MEITKENFMEAVGGLGTIADLQAANKLQELIIAFLGYGYHPDTNFDEYINFVTRERTFSDEEARRCNELLSEAFTVYEQHGMDIYDYATSFREQLAEA